MPFGRHNLMTGADGEVSVLPAVVADNTAQVGVWHNMQGCSAITFFVMTGDIATANATFAVTMHHADADDQSDIAAVPAANLVGTLAAAGFSGAADRVCRKVAYLPGKKWVRFSVTPTGNTGNAPLAVLAVKHPVYAEYNA